MRRLWLCFLLMTFLFATVVAEAAQVTGTKWGVSRDNVLRLVVELSELSDYTVNLEGNQLKLTINGAAADGVAGSYRVKSTLADVMNVASSADGTVVLVPLKKQISSKDIKAFVLKKDPLTGRPSRVVVDVTADKAVAASAVPAVSAGSAGVVISNKPVRNGSSVQPVREPEKRTEPSAAQTKKPDIEKVKQPTQKPAPVKKNENNDIGIKKEKSNRAYKTSGGIKGKIITLDPGHGGTDPGAIGKTGLMEKEITLIVSREVRKLLEAKGAEVRMTRTEDVDVFGPSATDVQELRARVNVAEKHGSDIFISVHVNASTNRNIGGFSSYYYPKTEHDKRLAAAIQNKLVSNFGVDDLGIREANFYVVKRCSMPATLLELCFISNPKEEKLMQSKWYQRKAAHLIVEGIEEYFAE